MKTLFHVSVILATATALTAAVGLRAGRIGFENFPMTGFGVVSPRLKAIAKTPVLPGSPEAVALPNHGWGQNKVQSPHKASMKTHWRGAVIKDVQTEGDYGCGRRPRSVSSVASFVSPSAAVCSSAIARRFPIGG